MTRAASSRQISMLVVVAALTGAGDAADGWARPAARSAPLEQAPPEVALDDPLVQARLAFDSGRLEEARDRLDALVTALGTDVSSPAQRTRLAASYGLRGRTRLGLRDVDGARSDFRAMLLVEPVSVLPPDSGARAQALFEEVRAGTVGDVAVTISPEGATVVLDGVPLPDVPPVLVLVGGTHTIAASRDGYRDAAQTFTVVPGTAVQPIVLSLDREFSTLTLRTVPPGVEVIVDGIARGVTQPAAQAGGAVSSQPFVVEQLLPGRHRLQLELECHVTTSQDVNVARPDDLALDVIRLRPAVASVSVTSDGAGAVFVDDLPRGSTPQVLEDVCEGPHVFEVRTPGGRHVRRLSVKTGEKVSFAARVRPAFALLPDARDRSEAALAAEAAFDGTRTLAFYAPDPARAAALAASEALPADWLAFDLLGRPLGGAASVNEAKRRTSGARMAAALGAQGLAWTAADPDGAATDRLLILLAPGSARPDVLAWRAGSAASVQQAMVRLEMQPAITRSWVGLSAIDVLDVRGAVVSAIDAGGPAARAGVLPAEIVIGAGGRTVTSAAELSAVVDAHEGSRPLALELLDRGGTSRTVELSPLRVPQVVAFDRTLQTNALAAHFASRAATASAPLERSALRLNLAAAYMSLQNWQGASSELERVIDLATGDLPAGPARAAVAGTAQYLLGLCARALGDTESAERAWSAAAASGGWMLTAGAEPIADLVARRRAAGNAVTP